MRRVFIQIYSNCKEADPLMSPVFYHSRIESPDLEQQTHCYHTRKSRAIDA